MLQEGGLYPGIRPLEALQLFASLLRRSPTILSACSRVVGLDDSRHTPGAPGCPAGSNKRLSLAAGPGRSTVVGVPRRNRPRAWIRTHAPPRPWGMFARAARPRRHRRADHATRWTKPSHLCDRVGIIDHGRLVACDSPAELTTRAAADETTFATHPRDSQSTTLARHPRDPRSGPVRELRPGRLPRRQDQPPTPTPGRRTHPRGCANRARSSASCAPVVAASKDVFLRLTGEGHS